MRWNSPVPIPWRVMLVPVVALLTLTACSPGTTTKTTEETKPAAAAPQPAGPNIDLNLIVARLQKPPDSFHYSYKANGAPHILDDEVDVTPQALDGTFTSNVSNVTKPPITGKVHAVSTNQDDWQFAVGSVSGMLGLNGMGGLIVQNAASEGSEPVNGYDTTKYSVDTTRGDAASNAIMLGQGGFIKGNLWTTSDGCPVKMTLDEEIHHNDGSVTKYHIEENITKK